VWIAGCATPSASRIAPCWEEWSAEADAEAVEVFGYDPAGVAQRHLALEERVDYLDAYCLAANAALGQEPAPAEGLTRWERSWLGRLLRWPGR